MGSELSCIPRIGQDPELERKRKEEEAIANEANSGIRSKLVKHHDDVEDVWKIYEEVKVLGEGMTGSVIEVAKISTKKQYINI